MSSEDNCKQDMVKALKWPIIVAVAYKMLQAEAPWAAKSQVPWILLLLSQKRQQHVKADKKKEEVVVPKEYIKAEDKDFKKQGWLAFRSLYVEYGRYH